MKKTKCVRITFLPLVVISLAGPFNNLMAAEEAEYSVLEPDGDFELRQYQPQIVAETLVTVTSRKWATKASDVYSTISQVQVSGQKPGGDIAETDYDCPGGGGGIVR